MLVLSSKVNRKDGIDETHTDYLAFSVYLILPMPLGKEKGCTNLWCVLNHNVWFMNSYCSHARRHTGTTPQVLKLPGLLIVNLTRITRVIGHRRHELVTLCTKILCDPYTCMCTHMIRAWWETSVFMVTFSLQSTEVSKRSLCLYGSKKMRANLGAKCVTMCIQFKWLLLVQSYKARSSAYEVSVCTWSTLSRQLFSQWVGRLEFISNAEGKMQRFSILKQKWPNCHVIVLTSVYYWFSRPLTIPVNLVLLLLLGSY